MTRRLLALLLCLFIGVQNISATHTNNHHHHKDATPPFSTGMYVIESQHSNQVLESTKTGHILLSHPDSDHNNMFQRFYLKHAKGNTYYLLGAENRKIVELTTDGTAPQERKDFSFGDEDTWKVSAKPEGGFSFQHLKSGKYLSAKHSSVHMVNDDSEPGTVFKVHKHITDGVYTIKAKDSSQYLQFDNNRAFLKSHSDASNAGKFFVKTHGPKHLSIVDFKTNHALTHDLNTPHLTLSPYTEEDSQKLVSLLEGGHLFKFQSSHSEHLLARCESEEGDDAESRLCLSSEGIEGAFELIQKLELPALLFNERAYLSSHDSYSNTANGFGYPKQEGSVTEQLQYGVRSLNFDIWTINPQNLPTDSRLGQPCQDIFSKYPESGIYVFHDVKELGCVPGLTIPNKPLRLYSLLQEVVDFLKKNSQEIVIVDFEDDGWVVSGEVAGPDYNLLKAEFAKVNGFNDVAFSLDTDLKVYVSPLTMKWPLISDMILNNKRLIMFPKKNYYTYAEARRLPLSVGNYDKGYLNGYKNGNTNPLEKITGDAGGDYRCFGFETDAKKFSVKPPLFTITHTRTLSKSASKSRSFNDNDFWLLWSRVRECRDADVPFVNSIQVDNIQTPLNEPRLVIQKINDDNTATPTRLAQCVIRYNRIDSALPQSSFSTQRTCPDGYYDNSSSDQCIKPCDAGWTSDLLKTTCYRDCQEGTTGKDLGTCTQIKDSIPRDVVYPQYFKATCDQATGKSCDGVPFAWHPKCKAGYSPSSNFCTALTCPTGTTNVNNVCITDSVPTVKATPFCKSEGMQYFPSLKSCLPNCAPGFEPYTGSDPPKCSPQGNVKSCPEGWNMCTNRCINKSCGGQSGNADPAYPAPVCNID